MFQPPAQLHSIRPAIPSLAHYGLIGNSRTAALVSDQGSIDWCCFPRFDSQSFFAALLDKDRGGLFSITPMGAFRSSQSYFHDTNVLVTSFDCPSGSARLCDCFSVTSEQKKRDRLFPDQEILRVIEGTSGEVKFRLRFQPRANYGSKGIRFQAMGSWGIACHYKNSLFLLQVENGFHNTWLVEDNSGDEAVSEFTVRAGERMLFSMIYAEASPAVLPALGDCALDRYAETILYWKNWIRLCRYDGAYNDQVRRSALTLKLLTFAPSGAIVASPTTSLPETPGGIRNWDYRYCWLRDASMTVRALLMLGMIDEAKAYVNWLLDSTALTQPRLQVMYSVFGETRLTEKELGLSGYLNSRPVRIGNAASKQFQLDVYGEVIDAFSHLSPYLGSIDPDTRKFVIGMGKAVCELWDQPDEGIWEPRSGPRHHTHSKALAWIALNRICQLGEQNGWKLPRDRFVATRNLIRNSVERYGYNPNLPGYTGVFGGAEVDSSLLVLPILGYCAADSPRMRETVASILARLAVGGLIRRYPPLSDRIEGREGAFGICNFWMSQTLMLGGDHQAARFWFESLLSHSSGVMLLPEEFDPDTGEFLGNYPQAFTHIGLINAAMQLSRAEHRYRRKSA